MSKKPEIAKMLVLSTAHLTQFDFKYLEQRELIHPKGTWGWFMYAAKPTWRPDIENIVMGRLRPVIAFAKRHKCDWIMFDQDGPIVKEIPSYDW